MTWRERKIEELRAGGRLEEMIRAGLSDDPHALDRFTSLEQTLLRQMLDEAKRDRTVPTSVPPLETKTAD